jgi:hypothetical protein
MLVPCHFVYEDKEVVYETLILYATKDVMLRSERPTINFNGKTEAMKGYGYGIKRAIKGGKKGGKITYPIMILEENKTIIAPRPLKNMGIYVCRCNKDWDEKKLIYNDMYKTLDPEEYGAHVARKTHLKDMFTCTDENTMTIKSNKHQVSAELPFKNAPGFVEFDVTSLFIKDIGEGVVNFVFLIFITSIDFPDYTAVDKKGNLVSTGDIEIALFTITFVLEDYYDDFEEDILDILMSVSATDDPSW